MAMQYSTNDSLTLIFSALAHPARRKILSDLKSGKATVKQLARPFEMSLPAMTKHLKILEKAGLITRSQDAQWRYSELDPTPLNQISDWLMGYSEYLNQSFDKLEDYIDELKEKEKLDSK